MEIPNTKHKLIELRQEILHNFFLFFLPAMRETFVRERERKTQAHVIAKKKKIWGEHFLSVLKLLCNVMNADLC